MTSKNSIANEYSEAELETVAELASQNYGPRDIALNLQRELRAFMRHWRDQESALRKAYERGILEIDIIKKEKLNLKVKSGSLTAILTHNKNAEQQRFQDIKNDVFNLDLHE